MSKLDSFAMKVGKFAEVVNQNKYLYSIKTAFTIYMPFIIVGSFATLFNTILCSEQVGLAQVEQLSFLSSLSPAFTAINYATMSTMSLALAFLIGKLIGQRNEMDGNYTALVALISFITIVPQSIVTVVEGLEDIVTSGIATSSINAQGLFVAMLISILSVELFSKLMQIDRLKIRMPEAVPSGIARSFNSLIPILLVLLIFSVISTIIYNISGDYLSDIIYNTLQAPLQGVMQGGPVGIILLAFASAIFWIFGLHGNMVIMPILSPLALAGLADNIAQTQAGDVATNPLTMTFFRVYVVMGGAGITIALVLAQLIFSKREDQKMISKLALIPGIFGINEPLVYGLPIVMNPIYAIPFILSQLMATAVAYFATVTHIIPAATVEVPFGLPLFVNAFVGYQTISAILVQLVILVLAFLIYTPFVLASNRLAPAYVDSADDSVKER
ncbi:PTS sugar transporter subunit IIC [Enterococcus sp. LJL128]|uniref:PTS sugar transporter subunit IIC n=1 Tax=Enterococcus sp. LJL51 TaxID=3416656 RepID=UPI003CEEBF23